jgi:hypothetical protein
MKTSDNGSLFILDEMLELMEGKFKKKGEWKKRK